MGLLEFILSLGPYRLSKISKLSYTPNFDLEVSAKPCCLKRRTESREPLGLLPYVLSNLGPTISSLPSSAILTYPSIHGCFGKLYLRYSNCCTGSELNKTHLTLFSL